MGSRDPTQQGGFEPETFEPEKATSNAAAAFLIIEKQECLGALTSAEKNRIAAALGSAGEDQINTFISVFSDRVGKARKPAALAVHLAWLANRGELAVDAPMLTAAASATEICAAKATWHGHLHSPIGMVAASRLDAAPGQLRSPTGLLFSLADSSIFWVRVDAGELDFVSADTFSPVSLNLCPESDLAF